MERFSNECHKLRPAARVSPCCPGGVTGRRLCRNSQIAVAAIKQPLRTQQHSGKGAAQAQRVNKRSLLLGGFCPCCCACCQPRRRNKLYDKYFAFSMANLMAAYEEALHPLKQQLFETLTQDQSAREVLEIGVGPGPNFKYYSPAKEHLRVTGLDPNTEMRQYANDSAYKAGLSDRFSFVEGSLGALPFQDGAFDAAVMTLVLCSVPSQTEALKDIKRVLKPGGRLYLIEHVVASQEKLLLRFVQGCLTPLQQALADNCHMNRDTLKSLKETDFDISKVCYLEVDNVGPFAPHIVGWASS